MSGWAQFSILWWITGNPLVAAMLVLFGYAVADWYTFGFLRGVAQAIRNLRRAPRLARQIKVNPHDRRARAELGEILVEQGRWARAVEVLRPAAQEDPHDLPVLYSLGLACLRLKRHEEGELFLRGVHGADPEFRLGRAPLEIGKHRLRRGDAKGAIEPLREYVASHPHRVEGHYFLARALAASGDLVAAKEARRRAWEEYETALPYQRRVERGWAWRARPSRPLLYAAIICTVLMLLAPSLSRASRASALPATTVNADARR